jgi:hypothetical protein
VPKHTRAGQRHRYDLDVSDISDPGRPGRGDRKRAQKLIDAAYAAGQLSAADRARRMERVESAYTKGDLAVIVRDLGRPGVVPSAGPTPAQPTATSASSGQPSLGSAIPKDQFDALLKKRGKPQTVKIADSVRTLSGDGVRRVRRIALILIVGFFILSALGVAAVVGIAFTQVDDAIDSATEAGSTPTSSLNLQTPKGWVEWVTAVKAETGTTRVYDAVVYPEYAAINAMVDEGAMRYVYRNGAFQMTNSSVTAATSEPVDLAGIDAEMVAELPDQTAERQKMPDYDSAYMIVNRWSGSPSIMVYLQQAGKLSRWSIYDFDGKVVGGTP